MPKKLQFTGELFPFQEDVLAWTKHIDRGILGLEMGLGKTVVTIALMCQRNYKKTIIVLPLQILDQWRKSILKFTNLKPKDIAIYQGRSRKNLDLEDYRVVMTTYDVVRIDVADEDSNLFKSQDLFDCIILDEAHKIRNSKTQLYQTCVDLATGIDAKWLLTGTTIHNKLKDFTTLCDFLKLKGVTASQFTDPDSDLKKKYYYKLTKAQCDLQLPPKSIHTHFLNFDEEHAEYYQTLFEETKELYDDYAAHPTQVTFNYLISKILRLRQCCNHMDAQLDEAHYKLKKNRHDKSSSAKFDKILEIIGETEKKDKLLIFSQWSHSLNILAEHLDKQEIDYLQYDGSMELAAKNAAIDSFKKGKQKVMLITLTSGGVGLDLSFANHIILMDSWWNPALEEQAIDRVYRIGQKKKVEVHRMYMIDTIEQWMVEMKKEKKKVDTLFHEEDIVYHVDQSILQKILHKFV
jgi:SNF2 family DNA or RNA helicase